MTKEYDKYYYVDRAEDIAARRQYDDNGVAKVELLPGVYDEGITCYKYFLKAGSSITPELYADKTVAIFFGKGLGELKDSDGVHKITEVAFYVPYMDKVAYSITAEEDMEFVFCIVEMNRYDKQGFNAWHIRLPHFRLESECVQYIQDCKTPNADARMILCDGWVGRILVGTTRAVNGGTIEKGHPQVHQFNYCVGNSDFTMSVGYKAENDMETIECKAGDWSFIPAGPDHDLVSADGKEAHYIWFEHYVNVLKMMP